MMLYQEIRQRCRMYHQNGQKYDRAYTSYMMHRNQTQTKWDNPDSLDYDDAERLITFLNEWGCMIPFNNEPAPKKVIGDLLLNNMKTGAPLLGASTTIRVATMNQLLNNLKSTVPLLNTLRSATLFNVHFDENRRRMLSNCFNAIAMFGIRNGDVSNEAVATSKLLHVAINPNLFVMWDGEIQPAYILQRNRRNTGFGYAEIFLQRMQQRLAERAVKQVMAEEGLSRADAIQSFTEHCEKKNSLAKIIDEYNYAKYTAKWPLYPRATKSNG